MSLYAFTGMIINPIRLIAFYGEIHLSEAQIWTKSCSEICVELNETIRNQVVIYFFFSKKPSFSRNIASEHRS